MREKIKILVALILACTCAGAAPAHETDRLARVIDDADVIVLADVVDPNWTPTGDGGAWLVRGWSGVCLFTQEVRYRIVEVLRGDLEGGDIIVSHPLVYHSRTADPDTPMLKPSLFHAGARLVLFLNPGSCSQESETAGRDRFCASHQDFGALAASDELLERVRAELARRSRSVR